MVEDGLDLLDILGSNPELLFRTAQTLGLDVFYLIHRVLLLLSPFEFLVKEVKDHKVETPQIISSC